MQRAIPRTTLHKLITLFLMLNLVSSVALAKVRIAIIDTGIDTENKLLAPFVSPQSKSFSAQSSALVDSHGHGTHIASIIVENSNLNAQELELLILKYYDAKSPPEDNLANTIKSIRYAIQQQVDIINYSGGGTSPSPEEQAILGEARHRGILVIAAAGNEHSNSDLRPFYPANYPLDNIISVGSHDSEYNWVPSSNFGTKAVDIAALGKSVMAFLPKNTRAALTGTSQATAMVSALAANLKVTRKDLKTYLEIKEHILKTSFFQKGLQGKNKRNGAIDVKRAQSMRDASTPALLDEKLAFLPNN